MALTRNQVGPTRSGGSGGTATLSAGNQAKVDNLPAAWQPNTPYTDGQGVLYNGVIYSKNGNGNSGATFTPANWTIGDDTNTQLYRGQFNASGGAVPTAAGATVRPGEPIVQGEFFYISLAGTIGGVELEVGDQIFSLQDNPTDITHYNVLGKGGDTADTTLARGNWDASASPDFPAPDGSNSLVRNGEAIKAQEIYRVSQAGTIQGTAVQVDDLLIAKIDNPTNALTDWIIQGQVTPTSNKVFRGNYDPTTNTNLYPDAAQATERPGEAILAGDRFTIIASATLGTRPTKVDDQLIAKVDNPGQTEANWILQTIPEQNIWAYAVATDDPGFATPLPSKQGYVLPEGGSVALNSSATDGDWWYLWNPSNTQSVNVRFAGGTWEGEIISATQDATLQPSGLYHVRKLGTVAHIARIDNLSGDVVQHIGHAFTLPTVGFIAVRHDGTNYVQATSTLEAEAAIVRIYGNDFYRVSRNAQIHTGPHGLTPGKYLVLDTAGNAVEETATGPQRVGYIIDANTILVDIDSGGTDTPTSTLWEPTTNGQTLTAELQYVGTPGETYTIPALNPGEEVYMNVSGTTGQTTLNLPDGVQFRNYSTQTVETTAGSSYLVAAGRMVRVYRNPNTDVYEVADWFSNTDFQIVGLDENRACPNTTGLQFTVQAVNVSAGPITYSIVGSGGAVANPAIDSNTGVVTYDSPTPINNGLGYIDISATDSNSKVVTQRIQIQQAPPLEESGLGGNDNIVRFSTPFGAGDTRITSYGQQGLSIDSLGGTADQIFSDAGATAAASNGGNVLSWLNNGTGENWKVSTGNGKNGPELIIGGGPNGNDALSFDSANEEHLWMYDPSTPANQAFAFGIVYNITSLPEYGSLISFGSVNNGHDDMNNLAGGTPGAVQISRGGGGTTNDFVFALNNGAGSSNATITNDVHNDISDGNWHLLTCYYDGAGNVRVYIDGVEVVNFAITNPNGIVCNTVRIMQNRGGNAHVTGLVSDFLWLDNPTLEQIDRMQANLLFRNGFPLSSLAANAAPFSRDALFYTAPSDYILQTYCDGSVQVYDSNSGTYFDETNMPVPGIGLFLGANALAVINEAQSGGGVQSVTGAAVDNTDPLNPVITSSGGPADTDALPEGSTNLYYTEARVNANPNVATNTAKTGITTLQANSIAANNAKVSADGSINSHSDVDTSTATPNNGEALVWDGSNWVPTSLASSPSGLQNSIQLTGDITPSAFTEPTAALYWNTSSNSHTVTLTDGNWPVGSVVHFINFNSLGNIQVSMSGASILDASDVLTSYPVYGGSKLTLTKVAASSWLILNHTDQLIGEANLTGGSQQLLTAGSLTFANAYTTYRALRYEFVAVEGANRYSLGAAYSESVSDFITAVMSDTAASPLVAFSLNSANQNIAIAAGLGAGATNYDSLEVKVYGVR